MKKQFVSLPAILMTGTLILTSACSGKKPKAEAEPAPTASKAAITETQLSSLTREHAVQRSKHVHHISYKLWFKIDGQGETFEGRTTIRFDLKRPNSQHTHRLPIDFDGGDIKAVTLNGKALEGPFTAVSSPDAANDPKVRYDGHKFYLALEELQPGANQVEFTFSHPYSTNGNGLHRSVDPADGEVYLFTHFEPFSAHRLFPCFDQPDLKATYELAVEAPPAWQVISNTKETSTSNVDGRKSWSFPVSPALSTYLFALHAGPYVSWKGQAGDIPLRLFSRKSVEKYVDHKEWLDITAKGLAFYNQLFGYPYPFGKYDQIIVPDFNAGAMENAGAVTFAERRYVFRSKENQDRHRGRANVILHEMAHMWFGDLVTMKWWNGLWLNESFATFMAALAVDQATDFKGSWQDFFAGEKRWAYDEDQLVTTHPIDVPVADTDVAFSNFDGITYGKGASVLKQLRFFLGQDDFREGLQRYFARYGGRTATLKDFIGTLAESSGKDLKTWEKSWLLSPGVNTLRADWSCQKDDKTGKSIIASFKLTQGNSETSQELRPHKTKVALYYENGRRLATKEKDVVEVQYSAAETPVPDELGKPCPDFVFPNQGDEDYVKVELDPISLAAAKSELSHFQDPLMRQMLWSSLWDQVIDGKFPATEYAQVVLSQLKGETDTQVISRVIGTLVNPRAAPSSAVKFMSAGARVNTLGQAEALTHAHLLSSPAGSDLQLTWYFAYLDAAGTPEAQKWLAELLDGKKKVHGLKIDQERRWEIISTLARLGAPEAPELIAKEAAADPTDMGKRAQIRAEASLPDPVNKKKWLTEISEPTMPIAKLREAMRSFHLIGQEQLSKDAVDPYFNEILKLDKSKDEEFIRSFSSAMYPALCDQAIDDRATDVLNKHPELPAAVVKNLKMNRQEDQRCIRARQLSGS